MSSTVQVTPSYDEFTLVASGYRWISPGERSITWEYRLITNSQWHTTQETVTGSPTSLTHKFTGLLPGRKFIYRVTFTDGGIFTSVQGSVTTLTEIGTLSITHTSASSLTATFADYVTASYTRVARFRYGRTPSAEEQKPTSYDCGQVVIPPNTTDKEVSTLITGLRNSTSYNVYMTLYKVTYSGGTQRLVYMADYSVTATTGIPSSESPDVELFSIVQRYDAYSLRIKLNTDYQGIYRFILFVCDDVDSTYWHTLVLPPMETEFYASEILAKFRNEDWQYNDDPHTFSYTHRTDNVDIKVCICVESDTEEEYLIEKGFTYPIGNAMDIQEPHTGLPAGMTVYGMTDLINVEFDVTPIIPLKSGGAPFDITAQETLHLAQILASKYETPYREYTYDEWKEFCISYDNSMLGRLYHDSGYQAMCRKVDELNRCYEELIQSLNEAMSGAPVYAHQGSLIKSMETIAEALATATVYHEDAQPFDIIGREYFNDLSSDIKQTP